MHILDFLNSGFPRAWVPLLPLFAVAVIWSIIWKGLALWRAARNNHTAWFVVFLVVNTVGILEIIYLLTAGKTKENKV